MKVVSCRRPPLVVAVVFVVVFCTGYYAVVSRNRSGLHQPIKNSGALGVLGDLEWRIKAAVAQSNERSKDFVDLKRLVAAIDENRGLQGNLGRAPSSVKKEEAMEKVPAAQEQQPRIDLIGGMDHIKSAKDLEPAIHVSKNRRGVSMAIGVPTVKREVQTYLQETLKSLFSGMSVDEKSDVVVIVMIAELEESYCRNVIKTLESMFQAEIESGTLEIIVPPASFYPDLKNIPLSFGDPLERVQWRTKQNLDYAFMMLYACRRARYYLQIEDDVISTPGFPSRILTFAQQQSLSNPTWVLLEFSALGFIGKLFRSSDVTTLSSFFLMFHKDKPIDWLLDHFLFVKVCHPEQDMKFCSREKGKVRIRFKPSLFQHVGQHSSLKGKIQKLKDKDFKNDLPPPPFMNPPARLSTSVEAYQHHTMDEVYLSRDFFWATTPKKGDHITFDFEKPITLTKIVILSGNNDHPGDICTDVSVDGYKYDSQKVMTVENAKTDPAVTLCKFDDKGRAECDVPDSVGPFGSIKLTFLSESKAWVIIRQVNFHWLKDGNGKLV